MVKFPGPTRQTTFNNSIIFNGYGYYPDTRSLAKFPIHGAALRPDQWVNWQLSEIGRLNLRQGNRTVTLAELFDIQGDPADQILLIQGDVPQLDYLGLGLTTGQIIVQGSVGIFVPLSKPRNDYRSWLGRCFSSNTNQWWVIGCAWKCRQNLAGVFSGSQTRTAWWHGHRSGNAGPSVGQYQRRGLIIVLGDVGHEAGYHQLAGTIILGGMVGSSCGRSQRRGTIWLLETPEQLASTFDPGRVIAGYQGLPVAKQVLGKQVSELCLHNGSDSRRNNSKP